jgi:uroporphyrinogen-III synthase
MPVILTREPEDNRVLCRELQSRGIAVIEYPCLATRWIPPEHWHIEYNRCIEDFRVWVFTSKRAVKAFAQHHPSAMQDRYLADRIEDKQKQQNKRILLAAVGRSTADQLTASLGLSPDLVGADSTGEGLARDLLPLLKPKECVLHIRGDKTTGGFQRILVEAGFDVSALVVYENVAPSLSPITLETPTILMFASPSAAQRFYEANPHLMHSPYMHHVAIGMITARYLTQNGHAQVTYPPEPSDFALGEHISTIWQELVQNSSCHQRANT